MAHFTLIARINGGDGKFPFVSVQFSKNHRPISIPGATYCLRPTCGNRNPVRVGQDVTAAHTALINSENRNPLDGFVPKRGSTHPSLCSTPQVRKTVEEASAEYIERSKMKQHKTYLGYRNATNLFVAGCKKGL